MQIIERADNLSEIEARLPFRHRPVHPNVIGESATVGKLHGNIMENIIVKGFDRSDDKRVVQLAQKIKLANEARLRTSRRNGGFVNGFDGNRATEIGVIRKPDSREGGTPNFVLEAVMAERGHGKSIRKSHIGSTFQ
jgi:hypothetical protein